MGKTYETLEAELVALIAKQHVFFVATAPLADRGRINLSPKGHDTFRVLGPREVAYLDLTGSGIETIAHLRENGRIVVMFCTFEGPPKILRLWGRGEVVEPEDAGYQALAARMPSRRGARAIVRIAVEHIADSCGYSVPIMTFDCERDQLDAWTAKKDDEALAEYRARKNRNSLDGLPGLREAEGGTE
ncbi:MAG: pyridoxamine 5'-phosphate oxidase family protein [Polyangiales bacterium]